MLQIEKKDEEEEDEEEGKMKDENWLYLKFE